MTQTQAAWLPSQNLNYLAILGDESYTFRVAKPPAFLDLLIITANHAVFPLICDLPPCDRMKHWAHTNNIYYFIIYPIIYKQLALEEDSAMIPAGE